MESSSRRADWADGEVETEKIICPVSDGHQRGGKRLTDLSVTLPGNNTEDFVWTWGNECLLTDRVLELFESEGFTGFEFKPVKARYNGLKQTPPRLWELVVTGWAGIAPSESGIKIIESECCQSCGYLGYSGCLHSDKLIEESQWDGSDFFMVWPLPRFIFITDRVAEVIYREHITGAVIQSPMELDFSSGFGPGRLSYWMPEARAREIGEPLGIY